MFDTMTSHRTCAMQKGRNLSATLFVPLLGGCAAHVVVAGWRRATLNGKYCIDEMKNRP